MLHWTASRWIIHVHRSHVELTPPTPQTNASIPKHFPLDGGNIVSALAACSPLITGHRAEVECRFDDSYARFWMVSPPMHATDFGDLQAAARLRFDTLFSTSANEWRIEAEWQAGRDFLACALPQSALADVEQSLSSTSGQIRLSRCIPYFLDCWNRATNDKQCRPTCFAVTADTTTTVALLDESNQRIRAIFSIPLTADSDANIQEIENRIGAYCIQRDLAPPGDVLLTGQIPTQLATIRGCKLRWMVWHETD